MPSSKQPNAPSQQTNEFLGKIRQKSPQGFLLRYSLSFAFVALAMGIRLLLEAWGGKGLPTYITFYPAVMSAALLVGFGSGLLATLLTGLVASFWILPPVGFAVTSTTDLVGLVFFIGMGLYMSLIAELFRRNRDKLSVIARDAALRESEKRLALAVSATQVGMFELNIAKGTVLWTQTHEAIFGYAPTTTTTTTTTTESDISKWAERVHPEDMPHVEEESLRCIQERKPLEVQYRIIWPDGSQHWVETKGVYLYDNVGTASRMLGVVTDITGRKQAELALVQAKEEWERTFDSVPDLIAIMDSQHRITRVNKAMAERLQVSPQQCIGQLCYLGVHSTDLPPGFCPHSMTLADGFQHEAEVYEERLGGTFHVTTTPLLNEHGDMIGSIHVARDLTERKKIEDVLRFLNQCCSKEGFFEALARYLAKALEMDFICIDTLEDNYLSAQTLAVFHNGEFEDNVSYTLKETPCGEVVGKNICCFPENVCGLFPKDEVLQDLQAESYLGTTLWSSQGKPIGLIAAIGRQPLEDTRLGESILQLVAVRAAGELERLQAEEALAENKERLTLALTSSGMATFDWDITDNKRIWDENVHKLLGTNPETFTGSADEFFQIIHPEDRIRVMEAQIKAIESTGEYKTEYRAVWADGTIHFIAARGKVCHDSAGLAIRMTGLCWDITERKLNEAALINLNEELEMRVKGRTEDLEYTIEKLMEEISEREKAEENVKRLNRLYTVLSETNQTIVRTKDRNRLFYEFCRIAVEDGGFILSWVGLVDEASGEVRRITAYGKTAYLDDICITATEEPEGEGPTGITIRNGTYYICNDFQNDPCTRPWHERGKTYGINASAAVALKDGNRAIGVLTLYSGEKNYFDQQQVELLQQMGMDISYALDNFNREEARKEAEQALYLEATERLKTVEALREKEQMLIQQSRQAAMGEMIGNIAHQWRQPLNTLGLHAQKLGVFYGSPSFNKEFLDNSTAKTMEIIKHMSKTIDDFRDYFKPEKEKANFYVIEAINSTMSLLEGNFHIPKITVEFVERDNPVINGYQNEFAQVILNILNNARDAIIEREITDARVTIMICSENNCAVVTVADNAGGIPDEVINKVFDPYFTTKGPQVGTGIGLFMSKTIIEKNMGGRLSVRNTDSGAEFRIEVEHGTQN
jgi:PAS domain S-box-containing protein